ncbi:hypothetical protein Forpe1208_v000532 [Fusarium oxysporum f. sp. rapae]|uniref:Uncharacterized protein n=1 Tax=Fusarium oxysporum f. sp. rapae TaxID=485398 RepID=A0A8J5PNI2_FUSOX|nr:hypothetical protein Forpe1208_v000532 [Fusarium oxysporum f. sp. rapae]
MLLLPIRPREPPFRFSSHNCPAWPPYYFSLPLFFFLTPKHTTLTGILSSGIESEVSVWQLYYSFGLGPADSAQLHKVAIVSPDYCIDLLKRSRKNHKVASRPSSIPNETSTIIPHRHLSFFLVT